MPAYKGVLKEGQKWTTGEGKYSRTVLKIDEGIGRYLVHYQTDDGGLFWTDEHEFRAWCGGAQVVAEVPTGVEAEGPIVLRAEFSTIICDEWHISLKGNRGIWACHANLDRAVAEWIRVHSDFYGGDHQAVLARVEVKFAIGDSSTRRKMLPR